MVLETNMNEIVTRFDEQSKLEKQEAGLINAIEEERDEENKL